MKLYIFLIALFICFNEVITQENTMILKLEIFTCPITKELPEPHIIDSLIIQIKNNYSTIIELNKFLLIKLDSNLNKLELSQDTLDLKKINTICFIHRYGGNIDTLSIQKFDLMYFRGNVFNFNWSIYKIIAMSIPYNQVIIDNFFRKDYNIYEFCK